MNLQNGYKVIYDKAEHGKHAFYASKTGLFADAELIMEAANGEYKLIYEKDDKFYGSVSGIPAEGDRCFEELRAVFEEGYVADNTQEVEQENSDSGDEAQQPAEIEENGGAE